MDTPSNIGVAPGLQDAAFKLNEGNRYSDTVFENEKGPFVVRWEGKEGIDMAKYQEEKDQYRDSLISTKRQAIFTSWLERLKEKAEIDRTPLKKRM